LFLLTWFSFFPDFALPISFACSAGSNDNRPTRYCPEFQMEHPAFKAVLIGDSSVGKTSIFRRLESKTFIPESSTTISGAFAQVWVHLPTGTRTEIGLWDTAGQEKFRTIVPMYFQKTDILLVVFDLTNSNSFQNVDDWIALAEDKGPSDVQMIMIGNKLDLTEQRAVTPNEAQDKFEKSGAVVYIELSTLNGDGFDCLREHLSEICASLLERRAAVDESTHRFPGASGPAGKADRSQCC
jgi:small GTP-binding protein